MKTKNIIMMMLIAVTCGCVSKRIDRRTEMALQAERLMRLYTIGKTRGLAKPKGLTSIHAVTEQAKCSNVQDHIAGFHQAYLEAQGYELSMIKNSCTRDGPTRYKAYFSLKKDKAEYTFQLVLEFAQGVRDITTEKYETYKVEMFLVSSSGQTSRYDSRHATTNTNLDRMAVSLSEWLGTHRIYANNYSCSLIGRDYFSGDSCHYPKQKDLFPLRSANINELVELQVEKFLKDFSKNYLDKKTQLTLSKIDKSQKNQTQVFFRVRQGKTSILFNLFLRFKYKQGYYYITDNSGNPVKAQGEVRRLDSYDFYVVEEKNNKLKMHQWDPHLRERNILHPNIVHLEFTLKTFLARVLEVERSLGLKKD